MSRDTPRWIVVVVIAAVRRRDARLGARAPAPPRPGRGRARRVVRRLAGIARLRGVMSNMPAVAESTTGRGPRPPTMLDAVLPIVVLIGLLALTIFLFGIDATNGPLQVALLAECGLREPDGVQERVHRRGGGGRRGRWCHVGDRRDLHPARGRRADRHLEHGGDHPDHRRLRDPAGQPHLVLPGDGRRLCPGGDGDRQLLDHRRHARSRLRRDGERDGPQRRHRRRRGHLRRLLRRQDDPAVRDDDPRPQARRRRADRGRARAQHVLDRGSGARHQPRHLLLPGTQCGRGRRDQHRCGP